MLLLARLLPLLLLFALGCYHNDGPAANPAPLPPPCRIVKATYKTIYLSGPKTGYEALTIDGQTYKVYTWETIEYVYDYKGRITRQLSTSWGGSSSLSFGYAEKYIFRRRENADSKGAIAQTVLDTVRLNAKGYDDQYIYDEQGNLLTYKSWAKTAVVKIEAQNRVYHSEPYDGGRLNYSWTFDLNRPALPPIYAYQGVGDRNLVTTRLLTVQNLGYITNGPAIRTDFSYIYDASGRVARQMEVDYRYPLSNWSFENHPGGIGITDYQYECFN